ncbi:MAG: hypothetical protein DRG20_07030 [Deltaproteobacteria bacterium]|nr:ABC transporter permease subunit [Deltaproteobacteria bacterium]RLA87809.1 MAG: hypothetical protein DRG20_07030 [Deltaproteobacteria bacterium]
MKKRTGIQKDLIIDQLLIAPFTFFYVGMIIIPLILIFLSSFGLVHLTTGIPKGFSLEGYRRFFFTPRYPYLYAFAFTFLVTLVATILATFIGYILALFLKIRKPKWKNFFISMMRLPLFVPYLIASFMWWTLLYPKGYLSMILKHFFGLAIPLTNDPLGIGIILCAAWMKFSIAFNIMHSQLEMLPPDLEAAARNLGANTWNVIKRIYFPLTIYGVLSAAAAIFLSVFIAFSIAFVHGTSWPRFLSMLVYRDAVERGEWLMGYTISVIYIVVAFLVSYLYMKILASREVR